jgi:LmbE family N-acetylglucosaminyl deacetylase
MKNKKILIVAAHPDDEVLGCGGTVARLVNEGYEAYTLILGEGITSRDQIRNQKKRETEILMLKKNIEKAKKILGIKKTYVFDFPDNRFDSVPLLDIVKKIEEIKKKIKPNIIFTHYEKDLNIDHQITCRAVMTATRPVIQETVKEIYSFEISSSTEWSYPLSFSPNVFFDISKTVDKKLKAMEQYTSELCEYPHPRSIKAIGIKAQNWGASIGIKFAEAFFCIRNLR